MTSSAQHGFTTNLTSDGLTIIRTGRKTMTHPLDTSPEFDDILAFHQAFEHPAPDEPTLPSMELAQKRAKWMREEIQEFLDAVEAGDLAEAYDAMQDLRYFCIGTMVAMGTPDVRGHELVHGANMAKLHLVDGERIAVYGEDGKVVKPEGWTAPDHAPIIAAMQKAIEMAQLVERLISLPEGAQISHAIAADLAKLSFDEAATVMAAARGQKLARPIQAIIGGNLPEGRVHS